jgi:hypothetical protein
MILNLKINLKPLIYLFCIEIYKKNERKILNK